MKKSIFLDRRFSQTVSLKVNLMTDSQLAFHDLIANSEMVFMEYIRKVDGEPDLNVGEVLHIKEGKILSSKVYHA